MTQPSQAVDIDKLQQDMLTAFQEAQNPLLNNRAYYEGEYRPKAVGVATPVELRDHVSASIDFSRTYVDSLGARLDIEGFRLGDAGEADEQLWDWWQYNELDSESTLGHIDALVHGRAYITVAAPSPDDIAAGMDPTVPLIRVEPPTAIYAKVDPRTRQVTSAIRVSTEDGSPDSDPTGITLYLPDQTIIREKQDGNWVVLATIRHGLGVVPVIPILNRSRLSDLYGSSAITNELRSYTDAASRLLMNMQSTAELMANPQRLLFGIKEGELPDPEDDPRATYKAYMAAILAFEDPDGKAMQFTAAELRNYVEGLEQIAKRAAAATGLPPQYLSIASDNPASADAIRSSETRLVKTAERKAKIFGAAWEQAMRVAYRVMNPGSEIPPMWYRMETVWRDPSTPTYAAKADGVTKLYNNGQGIIPKEQARLDMGYTPEQRKQMTEWDKQEDPMGQLASMYGSSTAPTPKPKDQAPEPDPAEAA